MKQVDSGPKIKRRLAAKTADRSARYLAADPPAAPSAGAGFRVDGHQPHFRVGASLFDEIPDRHCHRQASGDRLKPLVLAVLAATAIQGLTSFSLTQLLSKAAQRLIAELRQKVQAHIGRLPISFHDSTKSGTLVSRIMSDVEGIRNLIGTGLVDLVGGLLTAAIALVVLFRISALMTALAFGFLLVLRVRSAQSIWNHSADLPRARQDQRRGHGPAGRIPGRRARGEGISRGRSRGAGVFEGRVAPAGQCDSQPDRDVGDEPVGQPAAGGGRRRGHVCGRAADRGRDSDHRRVFHLHRCSWDF